ncbi:hypothetical protein ACJDU8_17595 [Clostridium sp. WILCCON 0269]|uniref:Uncharacterized protein n=1 Tax=Candidatus Clostridium eludens TaxID=3381663 RepID=A0ABW8SN27_9CLOT
MFVAKVKRLKEETVTFIELRDLEDLIVTTMGEDVWLAILEFTQERIEELEEQIAELEADSIPYINSKIANLIDVIKASKRLNRKFLIEELEKLIN